MTASWQKRSYSVARVKWTWCTQSLQTHLRLLLVLLLLKFRILD